MRPERRLALRYILAFVLVFAGAVAATAADWRKELGIFRIGMIEAAAPPQAGRDAIRRAFEGVLGMPVEILVVRDWPQLIDAHASARVNYAIYSAAAYAAAAELCECVEPVAAATDVDGATGLRSVVLARRGKVRSLANIIHVKVAAPGPDDLTGWMAPAALLAKEGVALKGDEAFLIRTATAAEAVERFRDGLADAVFGWERSDAAAGKPMAGGTAADVAEVQTDILWRSPLIRFGPHAIQKSLDGEAKKELSTFLTGLHGSNPQAYDLLSQGHGGGFVAADDGEYSTVREIVSGTARQSP